jgi:hypothetical protein
LKIVHVVPLLLAAGLRCRIGCLALWGIVSECVNGVIASVRHFMSFDLIRGFAMHRDDAADVGKTRSPAVNDTFRITTSTGDETNEIAWRP